MYFERSKKYSEALEYDIVSAQTDNAAVSNRFEAPQTLSEGRRTHFEGE